MWNRLRTMLEHRSFRYWLAILDFLLILCLIHLDRLISLWFALVHYLQSFEFDVLMYVV